MVSREGAERGVKLATDIDTLAASIAKVQSAIAAKSEIWKMAADVYVVARRPPGAPEQKATMALALQYNLTVNDTAAILGEVLKALQTKHTALVSELEAIT